MMGEQNSIDRDQYQAAKQANLQPAVKAIMARTLEPQIVSHIYHHKVDGYSMDGHCASPAHAGSILVRAPSTTADQLRRFRQAGGIVLDIGNDECLQPSKHLVREAYIGKASHEHLRRLDEGRRLGLDLHAALDQTLGSDEASRERIVAHLSAPVSEERQSPLAHVLGRGPINPPRWVTHNR